MSPNICLGTVQFGLPYGITNKSGQVPENEVTNILSLALNSGICLLDTAQAYGNSEAVLGKNLSIMHKFHITSKLPSQTSRHFSIDDISRWERAFQQSCKRLGVQSLYGFLLHNTADLLKPGSKYLIQWLYSLRERGLVEKLGVSIYSSKELDRLPIELLELVQLPLSLYDQRCLTDGTISWLKSIGSKIYARSIYLQGLLLTPSLSWPDWIDPALCNWHSQLELLASQSGFSLLDLALNFVRTQQDLDAVVVGLCSSNELNQLSEAWTSTNVLYDIDWTCWNLNDSEIIDPRYWPLA